LPVDEIQDTHLDELRDELARARKRIDELEALSRTGELLDASLDFPRLIQLALELSLRVLPADAALLVTRARTGDTAHYLTRRTDTLRVLEGNPSRLAREVFATGRPGARRDTGTPGALAAAEVLGKPPALRFAVPIARGERLLGVLEVAYLEEPKESTGEDLEILRSVADHLAVALHNAELVRALSRRARELSHLYDIGSKIASHLELDRLLAAIVDSFLELVPADAAGIFLIDHETREIRRETLRGYDPDRIDSVHLNVGRGILGWVASTGKGTTVPDVFQDERYVSARDTTRSEMAAPLIHDGRVIGVFNLESDRPSAYSDRDLELLQAFSNHAVVSIVKSELHEEAMAKRRLEEQLEIARDIQIALLPRVAPEIPGHTLHGRNLPSAGVGGDYFDFLELPKDRWAIIVADVSGNGIPAGLIMAGFRAQIRAALRHSDDPREVLSEVNLALCAELEPDHFVTAFLAVYTPATGGFLYSNAGHEPGLLVRRGGEVEALSKGGLVLGAFPEAVFEQDVAEIRPGDRLLLYTDGLSDAGDPWGGVLGKEGILRLLREVESEVPSLELADTILEKAEAEAAVPPEESDDRTLVVLSREEG
jgi:sigma-B regulation protein RsbU (phosphoserine phosphatase)